MLAWVWNSGKFHEGWVQVLSLQSGWCSCHANSRLTKLNPPIALLAFVSSWMKSVQRVAKILRAVNSLFPENTFQLNIASVHFSSFLCRTCMLFYIDVQEIARTHPVSDQVSLPRRIVQRSGWRSYRRACPEASVVHKKNRLNPGLAVPLYQFANSKWDLLVNTLVVKKSKFWRSLSPAECARILVVLW